MFFCIFEIYTKFWTFSRRRWPSYSTYLRNHGPRKTWLDICLKSAVSEDPLTGNMVNWSKHCPNLTDSTVTKFIDDFEGNSVGKSLFYWYAKPYNCLLTDWLTMTSILFLIETIERNQFTCYYLKNKKVFLHFIFPFSKSRLNFKHFQTKKTLIAQVFPNYGLQKTLLDICLKSPVSEDPLTDNMVNGNKHCCNLNDRTVTIIIDHFEVNSVGKSFF